MNKEEKEVIEKIKNFMNNEEILQYKIKEKDIDTILNLIDRLQKENEDLELAYGLYKGKYETLQKENEELKEKNISIKELDRGLDLLSKGHLKNLKENYVSKDKIKAKIKELEENLQHTNSFSAKLIELEGKIKVLEELLEGE